MATESTEGLFNYSVDSVANLREVSFSRGVIVTIMASGPWSHLGCK